jgi:hypothetical protein
MHEALLKFNSTIESILKFNAPDGCVVTVPLDADGICI